MHYRYNCSVTFGLAAVASLILVSARRRGQREGRIFLFGLGLVFLFFTVVVVVVIVARVAEDDGSDEVRDYAVNAATAGDPGDCALKVHLARSLQLHGSGQVGKVLIIDNLEKGRIWNKWEREPIKYTFQKNSYLDFFHDLRFHVRIILMSDNFMEKYQFFSLYNVKISHPYEMFVYCKSSLTKYLFYSFNLIAPNYNSATGRHAKFDSTRRKKQ